MASKFEERWVYELLRRSLVEIELEFFRASNYEASEDIKSLLSALIGENLQSQQYGRKGCHYIFFTKTSLKSNLSKYCRDFYCNKSQ